MTDSPATTYSERKLIREQLLRDDVEGVSLDPATKCRCDRCGTIHFRPKAKQEEVSKPE